VLRRRKWAGQSVESTDYAGRGTNGTRPPPVAARFNVAAGFQPAIVCPVAIPRSGLPEPVRRTLAAGILPCARSVLTSLRHRGCARSATPAPGHGQPLARHARLPGNTTWPQAGSTATRCRRSESRSGQDAALTRSSTATRRRRWEKPQRAGRRPHAELHGDTMSPMGKAAAGRMPLRRKVSYC
jgi:hypothetical protein